jgi:hypothetical protein
MASVSRLVALAGVVVLTGAGSLSGQGERGPLASIRVVAGPVVTLDVPTNDAAAFNAATGILGAAGVRFGAEGPALDPAVPLVDFARAPEQSLTLTGLTVGDALDAIVRVTPRLRWSESDGMIVVRMTNRDSLLDRRIRRFAVDAATPRAALEALIRQLAPERISAEGLAGFAATTQELDARLPARAGRDVSLALDNVTLLAVLTAISRENGALSWTVSYARAPASIATATIVFRESARLAVAGPPQPAPAAAPPGTRPGPELRRLPVTGDVVSMLTTYSETARVPIGVERIPGLPASPFRPVTPPLDLEGLPPRRAVAIIVAHDSRYVWTERSGRFLVKPKPGEAGPTLLDTPLPSFVRSKEPFESVLVGLLGRLGIEDSRALPMRPTGPTIILPAGTLDAARQRPVDVSLRRATTARAALDAICHAAGRLSWVLRDESAGLGVDRFSLQITSPDGWRYSRSFTVPVAPPAPGPRRLSLPAEIDRDIGLVAMPPAGPNPFLVLASAARVPIGLELAPDRTRGGVDPRMTIQTPASPPLGPGRFSDALFTLLDRAGGYEMTVARGVLNIAPAGTAAREDHFLNQPIGRFTVTGLPTSAAVALLRQRMIPGRVAPEPPATRLTQGASALEQPLTLDLTNPTPRDVLNEIVRLNGNASWSIRYVSRETDRSARSSEEDCVISIAAHLGSMLRTVEFDREGSLRVAWPAPPTFTPSSVPPPPVSPVARRAVLNLPVQDRQIEMSLLGVCRALAIRCSIELSSSTIRGPMGQQMTTARYDFAGMAGPDAMEKMTELVPNLTWTADGPIYRIRSRAIAGAADLPLDRRIETFDRGIETFSEIFQVMRSLLDRTSSSRIAIGVPNQTVAVGGPPPSAGDRPIAISLRNATIRQILDEIVRQHGGIAWAVRYVEANGLYPELMLTLTTDTGGSGQGMSIR